MSAFELRGLIGEGTTEGIVRGRLTRGNGKNVQNDMSRGNRTAVIGFLYILADMTTNKVIKNGPSQGVKLLRVLQILDVKGVFRDS